MDTPTALKLSAGHAVKFHNIPAGTLLLALGCVYDDQLHNAMIVGSKFLFKFLWGEKEVLLPLICKIEYTSQDPVKLHEELGQSLGLFVRRLYPEDNKNRVAGL